MQRLILLASVSIFVAFAGRSPANAQIPVTDVAKFGQDAIAWGKQQADMARQIANELRIIKQLYDNYVIAERTFMAVSNARDIGGMMAALGGASRRFLPEATDLIDGIGTGARVINGAGSIRSANQIFNQIPRAARSLENGARWAEEMERRETTTANVQATANAALADIQDRMAQLQIMQARLAASSDLQDTAAVQGAIQIHQQNLAMHSASMQAMQMKLMVADRMESTRQEQVAAQSAARWADSTRWAIDALQGD